MTGGHGFLQMERCARPTDAPPVGTTALQPPAAGIIPLGDERPPDGLCPEIFPAAGGLEGAGLQRPVPHAPRNNPVQRIHTMRKLILISMIFSLAAAAEDIRVADDGGLRKALAELKAGDIIVLAPGTYAGGLRLDGVHGTADAPMVIRGADADRRPVIQGGVNGMHFSRISYLAIENLVVQDAEHNGISIDDGTPGEPAASHITLRNLHVRNIGGQGNCDGIKLSGVDHFLVEDCTIENWGRGGSAIDLVGCHDGVVKGCRIAGRGNENSGVQMKGGSARIKVVGCRFEHAGERAVNLGGNTDTIYFRPPVPDKGAVEASDLEVAGCVFSGSRAPIVFTGSRKCVVRNNTIWRPKRWVFRILQENRDPRFLPCGEGIFENNRIFWRSDELYRTDNVSSGTDATSFVFKNNSWCCLDKPGKTKVKLPVEEIGGKYGFEVNVPDVPVF